MYGMVNKAVNEMVVSRFGEPTWLEIKRRAGIELEAFISTEGYDDSLTYALVAAASEVLEMDGGEVLEAFGQYWVLETAPRGYGAMLDAGGKTLPEFLDHLPDLHARVSLILPRLQPPEFSISERGEQSLVLHYRSHRPGLQRFVIGLIKGLAQRFHTEVEVELRARRDDGLDHEEFEVRWANPGFLDDANA
jgi:hypothetical protein